MASPSGGQVVGVGVDAVGDRALAEQHHVARVVGHQLREQRLGLRVGDGRHAGGEEVDPRAHPVGVAGEDESQALALGEDPAELGDVLEGHGAFTFGNAR